MTTFADLLKLAEGKRKRHTMELPLIGVEKPITIGIRVMDPFEEVEVLANARAFALERKVADPSDGEPIYDFGIRLFTLATVCTIADTDDRFFSSIDQLLHSQGLISRDVIEYAFAVYEMIADEERVRASRVTPDQLISIAKDAVGGNYLPFCRLRPGTQASCFRSMAALWLNSLKDKSDSSSPSATPATEPNEEMNGDSPP